MKSGPEAAHGGATEQELVRFDVFSGGLHETLSLILNGLMIAALILASVTDMGLAYQRRLIGMMPSRYASKTAGIQLASPELSLIAAGAPFQSLPALSAGEVAPIRLSARVRTCAMRA